jgi:hypothetical protein
MLNKGPHILEALRALDDILQREQNHHSKKRWMLRHACGPQDGVYIATALHGDYSEIYTHYERQARAPEALGLSAVRIA